MTTIRVINFILDNPEFTNVVIENMDDLKPIQAIDFLNRINIEKDWILNDSLEKNTLLIYSKY
jgi:hypothetical protein